VEKKLANTTHADQLRIHTKIKYANQLIYFMAKKKKLKTT